MPINNNFYLLRRGEHGGLDLGWRDGPFTIKNASGNCRAKPFRFFDGSCYWMHPKQVSSLQYTLDNLVEYNRIHSSTAPEPTDA